MSRMTSLIFTLATKLNQKMMGTLFFDNVPEILIRKDKRLVTSRGDGVMSTRYILLSPS
jgi:hypothetical protein